MASIVIRIQKLHGKEWGDVNEIHYQGGIFQRGGQLKLFNHAKFSLQNIERSLLGVAGMRVRENGETYVCTRDIDPLLYPPSQVTAHFAKEE